MLTTTEITLVLKTPLRSASQGDEESNFLCGIFLCGILKSRLDKWQTAMSLPTNFKVTLKTGPDEALLQSYAPLGFSVWVNHHRCAYSRHLIDLVHKQIFKRPAYTKSTTLANVQLWLKEGLDPKQSYDDWKKQAIHFVAYLATEAVINSSAALVDSTFVKAFLDECNADLPYPLVQNVLRFLLSFHIPLREKDTIIQTMEQATIEKTIEAKQPAQAIAESLYSLLTPGKLELHLSSKRLKQILNRDKLHKKSTDSSQNINGKRFFIDDLQPSYAKAFKARLQKLNNWLLSTKGCHLQEVELIAADELTWTEFQLQFNHRLTPIQYTASYLEQLGSNLLKASDTRLETVRQIQQKTSHSENITSDDKDPSDDKDLRREISRFSLEPDQISDNIDYQHLIATVLKQFNADLNLSFQASQNNSNPPAPSPFKPYLFSEVVCKAIENLVLSVYPLLLTTEKVEHQLAQLHSPESETGTHAPQPQLIKSAYLHGQDSTYLAFILRYLLCQTSGIFLTLRDLKFILTELQQPEEKQPEENQLEEKETARYSCIAGAGIPTEFSVSQPVDNACKNLQQSAVSVAEAVRVSNTRRFFELTDKSKALSLSCYRLHLDTEESLIQKVSSESLAQNIPLETGLANSELALKILVGIANYASNYPLGSSLPPILITSAVSASAKAMLLQNLISADYPEVKVLYRDLLDSSVEIEIIATI
ncbi:MAG: hypothetical protein AAFQ95_00285 [Cyanobacteria bacterium J06621_3]